jgi:microcystin degradation protein MlrC
MESAKAALALVLGMRGPAKAQKSTNARGDLVNHMRDIHGEGQPAGDAYQEREEDEAE